MSVHSLVSTWRISLGVGLKHSSFLSEEFFARMLCRLLAWNCALLASLHGNMHELDESWSHPGLQSASQCYVILRECFPRFARRTTTRLCRLCYSLQHLRRQM